MMFVDNGLQIAIIYAYPGNYPRTHIVNLSV